jgi:molybdopterin-guanine dinucleotide biosynthesis protein A
VILDAVVLAGGASTRFGGDKLAAPIDGGGTVLGRSVGTAREVARKVVLVIGPDDPQPSVDGVTLARDAVAHRGPLAGLVTGLEALDDPDVALVLAGDMPTVRPPVVRLLVDALQADPTLAIAHLEADPVATLPLAARPDLVLAVARALIAADRRSLRALLDSVPSHEIPAADWRAVDPGGDTLRDIDTPEDLHRP